MERAGQAPAEPYDPGVVDLVRTWERAKASGDPEAMAAAALALAATPTFGGVPGGVPALLFEARSRAGGAARTRLTAALARAWVYAGRPERAAGFATEAQADAERQGDPALLADALDAQLAVHWGPDQLADRLRLTDGLEDAAAHLTDVEARLSAHLWRFSTGLETLDNAAVRRQLRALDLLAAESGSARVAFFAAARRGMHALLTGDLVAAGAALRDAGAAGRAADSPDAEAVEHTLRAGIAQQAGDSATLADEAASFEGFGLAEGIRSITAWAAVLWTAAGRADRARALLHQIDDFAAIPRDVDWLLTVYLLTDVAAAVRERTSAATGLELLTPYAGRGVIDAGGVAFAGVVDAALARACTLLDRPEEAAHRSASAHAAYRRIGATWLARTLPAEADPEPSPDLLGGFATPTAPADHPLPTGSRGTAALPGTPDPQPSPDPHGTLATPAGPLGTAAESGSARRQPAAGPPATSGRRADREVVPPQAAAGTAPPSTTGRQAAFGAPAEPRVLHLRPGDDGIWWVGRDGGPSAVRDMRGLHYLRLLLSRPGLEVPALALSDAVAGNAAPRSVDADTGPLLDHQALAAYRRRLGELDDELAEARAHADLAREVRLDHERDALLDQLRAATGLGGRARVAGGTHERARVAVRKAIAAAIERVAAHDPSLARLLTDTITTGATCRYAPDPDRPVRWVL